MSYYPSKKCFYCNRPLTIINDYVSYSRCDEITCKSNYRIDDNTAEFDLFYKDKRHAIVVNYNKNYTIIDREESKTHWEWSNIYTVNKPLELDVEAWLELIERIEKLTVFR